MSRWLNSLGAEAGVRFGATFAVRVRAKLSALPQLRGALWSRHVLWLDNEGARLHGASGRPLCKAVIHSPGDVASALDAVDAALPGIGTRGLHRIVVVVGGAFVCHFTLPWKPLPRPGDWLAAARTRFVMDGLGAPDGWRFTVPDGRWGCSRLVAAMPEALCAGIARLCTKRRLRLSAIEPAFTHAVSRHRSRIEDGPIAIVEIEDGAGGRAVAHVGFRNDRQWTGFIALPATAPLEHVLRDAALLCRAMPLQRTYLIAPADMQAALSGLPGAHWLPASATGMP
ncbi:MAG TPA: hypothetical protein VIT90_12135 [Lysobacter sp.]